MGVLDKFLDVMRLNPEDEDDDFYDDDFYDDEPPVTRKSSRKDKNDDYDESHSIKEKPAKQAQKITPMRPAKRQSAGGMEVCVIKPTSVEDAREIAETLLSNRAVVLNVEGLDVEINLTAGADSVMSAVLAGDADIGFCGTEATIYIVD